MPDEPVTSPSAEPTATPTAPATPATPEPTQTTPATPNTPPAAATPQQPAQEPNASAMVPSYRIRETREAAMREAREAAEREWQEREQQFTTREEQLRRQLQALVGFDPEGREREAEVEAVRSQFSKLYPGLAQLEERATQLQSIVDRAGDLETQNKHYWRSYGQQQINRLYEKAEDVYGSQLTDDGKRMLHTAFVGYVSSNPELAQRYTNDPTLVDEFWKGFQTVFVDPARRTQAAQTATRVGAPKLPQDRPSGAPQATPPPKPSDLDERAKLAWASYDNPNRTK